MHWFESKIISRPNSCSKQKGFSRTLYLFVFFNSLDRHMYLHGRNVRPDIHRRKKHRPMGAREIQIFSKCGAVNRLEFLFVCFTGPAKWLGSELSHHEGMKNDRARLVYVLALRRECVGDKKPWQPAPMRTFGAKYTRRERQITEQSFSAFFLSGLLSADPPYHLSKMKAKHCHWVVLGVFPTE